MSHRHKKIMDIGIIWALSCLAVAIVSLLVFIVRHNQPQATEKRAEWRATYPTLPNDCDMGIALMWTGLICAAGVMGVQGIWDFSASPNLWSGFVTAFAIFVVIEGVIMMLRFRLR